jgi:glycosyltransferase involved in cell wall biosynthesis
MRVLILADDCNPYWPPTPLFGYKLARCIADYVDVLVVTQIRNKPNIDREGMGKARVVYLNTEIVASPMWKLGVMLRGGSTINWGTQIALNYPSYLAFEWAAWRRFKDVLHSKHYDIVHRITPVSTRQPSLIAKRCPVPFLLGPINEGLSWPTEFSVHMSRNERVLGHLWRTLSFFPYHRSTLTHSDCILASCAHSINALPQSVRQKVINFPNVGTDSKMFNIPIRNSQKKTKTILFVGRLVPVKLPEVVVRAFDASPMLRRHRLVIVGDGPERPKLERLISEYHLSDCVELTGQKSHAEVSVLMKEADIFAFPSICETGGGVVIEAMACGLACVVVDHGGPATLVAPGLGIKIRMGDFSHIVREFTAALEQLVEDPALITRLGTAAHRHAMTYYSWDAKAQKLLEIYTWVKTRQGRKPDFWDQSNG